MFFNDSVQTRLLLLQGEARIGPRLGEAWMFLYMDGFR